jgi:hypothetical protein
VFYAHGHSPPRPTRRLVTPSLRRRAAGSIVARAARPRCDPARLRAEALIAVVFGGKRLPTVTFDRILYNAQLGARRQRLAPRKSVQSVKQFAHRARVPNPMPTRCRDATRGQGGGDGAGLGYSACPDFGDHRSKRPGPRICIRHNCPTSSLTSFRRRTRFTCHVILPPTGAGTPCSGPHRTASLRLTQHR